MFVMSKDFYKDFSTASARGLEPSINEVLIIPMIHRAKMFLADFISQPEQRLSKQVICLKSLF